jgi:hypothetical protein
MKKLLVGEKFCAGYFFGWLAGSNIFSPFFILSLTSPRSCHCGEF